MNPHHAGVKSSIVLIRRLADGETVPDDGAIFMALAENIGYDATGRGTFEMNVEEEIAGVRRLELHRCDLFDYRVVCEWMQGSSSGSGHWSERRREVIPGTGVLGQWEEFNRDPTPFFA